MFIDPFNDKIQSTQANAPKDELFSQKSDFTKGLDSQTNTKVESQEISIESNCEIQNALADINVINFEYLTSSKVYDPKHLPIEDKGKVYYYQDDPLMYKKIKK